MLKKVLILILALLPMAASAQYTAGYWKIHPNFVSTKLKNIIDTSEKVYYLASDNVFSFDKETQENEALNKSNYLSDVLISNIYYNETKDYVVITYRNSNIDVILSDGKIINMPEIKDAVIASGKAINDITFTADGSILAATEFGYVVIDDEKWVIKESHIYYKNFSTIAQVGTSLVAVIDNVISASQVNIAHDAVTSFISTGKTLNECSSLPISGSTLFINSEKALYLATLGGTAAAPTITLKSLVAAKADNIHATPAGFIANFMTGGYYYTFDKQGANGTRTDGGNEMYASYPKGNGTIWGIGLNGLHIAGDSNYIYANGVTIKGVPFWMTYNNALGKLYVQTSADNYLFNSSSSCNLMEISVYDGNKWQDETPAEIEGQNRVTYSGYKLTINPNDPHTYFMSLRGTVNSSMVYKVTDGQTKDIFTTLNAPGGYVRGATAFDSEGNLWLVYSFGAPSSGSNVIALPRSKVNSTTPVTKADFKKITVPNISTGQFKRGHFVISPKGDVKAWTDGNVNSPIIFWKGDINTANPTSKTCANFIDQDGKAITWTFMRYLDVDRNGNIWFTANGICSLNPEDVFKDNFTVNHIKVPRNDGTGLADYLLEGVSINCITTDAQNRKWIATATAGVYQVSEDGTQILRQFNTGNSMLPSDNVYSIACNDNGNSVFILTDSGLVEYVYGYNPTSADLSNVYCYPNPVRPDYTGLLTINGLTENALVKIADSAGNVIKQLKSAGGIATWDCCDANGDRVATGVYYVLASASGSGSGTIVSKFLVVK